MLCIGELHLILEVVLQHDLVEYCLSITLTIKVCNFSIVRGCNTSRVFFQAFPNCTQYLTLGWLDTWFCCLSTFKSNALFFTDYKVSQILCKEKPNLSFLQPHVKASLLLDSIAAALHLLNPKIKIWIPMALFTSYRSSGEKLRKYHANSSCVIACTSGYLCDHVRNSHNHSFLQSGDVQGGNWCCSLLGLKGLND